MLPPPRAATGSKSRALTLNPTRKFDAFIVRVVATVEYPLAEGPAEAATPEADAVIGAIHLPLSTEALAGSPRRPNRCSSHASASRAREGYNDSRRVGEVVNGT